MAECSKKGMKRRQLERKRIKLRRENETEEERKKRLLSDKEAKRRISKDEDEEITEDRVEAKRRIMTRSRKKQDEEEEKKRILANREAMRKSREKDRLEGKRQIMTRSQKKQDEEEKKRILANREAMRKSREEESKKRREQRLLHNRVQMTRSHQNEGEDQREERIFNNKEAMRITREEEDEDEREERTFVNREAKRRSREQDDEDERKERLFVNRVAMKKKRQSESKDKTRKRLFLDRKAKKAKRDRENEDEREKRKFADREAKKGRRDCEDEEEKEKRLLYEKEAIKERRECQDEVFGEDCQEEDNDNDEEEAEETGEETEENALDNREEIKRNKRRKKKNFCIACRAPEIMLGTQLVPQCDLKPLFEEQTIDNITERHPTGKKCEHCSAMLWPNEPKGLCCNSGFVKLEPLFDTRNLGVDYMKNLCIGDSAEASIYRKFARNINNAVSLASLKVRRVFPQHGSWIPAVVIQGKVAIQVGPVIRNRKDNSPPPTFSQLYVLDEEEADEELEFRFGSMLLSSNVSDSEKKKLRSLLVMIVEKLNELNPYIKDYISAAEIIRDEIGTEKTIKLVLDADKRPEGEHARRFNTDFHEITVLFDDEHPGPRDVVLVARGESNEIVRIRDTNRSADPLRFTLMFPEGNDGWHLKMKSGNMNKRQRNITGRMFYSYHLMVRHPTKDFFTPVLHSGKLTQEYMCLNAAKIENQELFYLKQKSTQKKLRSETYRRLTDQISAHDVEVQRQLEQAVNERREASFEEPALTKIGLPVILPASHTGSPRYLHKHYQDAMAIVRKFGKPDLFITFTCNAKWDEIIQSLEAGETANDRPDIVVRVFKEKFRCFLNDILKNGVLGNVVAHVYVIEFQKRGLPHVHMLIIFDKESKIQKPEDVDRLISAEFPVPTECDDPLEKERAEELLDLVKTHMVHACSSRCRPEGHSAEKCRKHFPQDYSDETMWEKNGYYPYYRRREHEKFTVEMPSKKTVDNRSIVPYCPWLLMKYKAHINVEVCVSVRTVKYLYKYIHKGPDRMMCMPELNSIEQDKYRNDEIEKYQDMRSIGSSEACWMIFSFPITDRNPAVMALRIHLEDEQTVIVDQTSEETIRAAADEQKETELTGFFKFNSVNKDTKVKYCDFPRNHVWKQDKKMWQKRQKCNVIGRIHTVHPTSGDIFYLRLLLNDDHSKGKESFEDLRTVNGNTCESYRSTCEALGLLQNDGEWRYVLQEAAETEMPSQIRDLFVIILMNCAPSDPRDLFDMHWLDWMDDIQRKYDAASPEQVRIMILLKIEKKLQLLNRELIDFNLQVPSDDERLEIANLIKKQLATKDSVIRQEELEFDVEELKIENVEKYKMLNEEQKRIYDEVLHLITKGVGGAYFIDAPGGTGKTFLLNTILSGVRTLKDQKNIALAVAYSGIAATLLSLGRTFHSRFKAPVDFVDETVTFNIKANDSVWKVIKEAKLIVWDEGPMSHRYLLEGLDRVLRDIMDTDEVFGGKVLIISGDFRQVLPVIKRASRAQVTAAALKQSKLWSHFKIKKLKQNMRVANDPEGEDFAEWLGIIGDGDIPAEREPDWIELKGFRDYCKTSDIDDTADNTILESLRRFVLEVFHQLDTWFYSDNWSTWISERAILAPRNVEVDMINSHIISKIPGDDITLTSADATVSDDDQTSFPAEFLNSQTPSGLPPHKLELKIGMVLILLRNLNPRKGLCNGTRLILRKASRLLLECTFASASNRRNSEKSVLIPRIELITDKGDFPIQWKRRQFPVRPAFAMTINKSQGQTFKQVGLWLQEPCFSHGQFYVACSRVGRPDGLHIAINENDSGMTRNVVYKEALT